MSGASHVSSMRGAHLLHRSLNYGRQHILARAGKFREVILQQWDMSSSAFQLMCDVSQAKYEEEKVGMQGHACSMMTAWRLR